MNVMKSFSTILFKNKFQLSQYTSQAIDTQQCNSSKDFPIEIASSLRISTQRLGEALKKNNNLLRWNIKHWENCFETLRGQGFKTEHCLNMVTKFPQLLGTNKIQLTKSIENWRNCQFGESAVIYLLTLHPHFLQVSQNDLNRRTRELQNTFISKQNVKKLLEINPNVMFLKWSKLQDQLAYLTDTMKVDLSEIYKSSALELRLEQLQCRHEFLKRLGLYKLRNPKASPLDKCTNPKLSDITDSSDVKFATKVAQVTAEEFFTFQLIYEKESHDNVDDIDESEDEGT